jgi:hypothetical protein
MDEPSRQRAKLVYLKHQCNPEDLLSFIQMDGFSDDWKRLSLDDDDLLALQVMLMANPKGAPVISATGGLRKLRFAPSSWNKSKSETVRVCYAFFEEAKTVLLVVAYSKSDRDNLTAAEKRAIKNLLEWQKEQFNHRRFK